MNSEKKNQVESKDYDLITILGPTATGKTKLAAKLAAEIKSEIISADSRQVYKSMNIGTGKDYDDYIVNQKYINCHLIDLVNAGTEYNVYEYQKDFIKVFESLKKRSITTILCGGSGMYIEAVLKGYKLIQVPPDYDLRNKLSLKTDEELIDILSSFKNLHNKTDTENRKRLIRAIEIEYYYSQHPDHESFPKIKSVIFGIHFERDIIRKRITERLKQRLDHGMIEEVQSLINSGISIERLKYYGLEYKFISAYLNHELSYDEMFTKLNTAIHQFAKRQMTWFRKMQNDGFEVNWIKGDTEINEQIDFIKNRLLR